MSDMLALSADYGARSEHLFNPAIGRLVALWGFHADVMPDKPPAPGKISAFVANPPTLQDMILADGVLMDIHPRAQLDFGAIAKGVALDEAREILRSHQIHNALINIGGNILALGNNGGSPWRIELRPATTQPSLGVIILKDGEAVATSGGGERRFIYQGKVYHHILDWRSGEPHHLPPPPLSLAMTLKTPAPLVMPPQRHWLSPISERPPAFYKTSN